MPAQVELVLRSPRAPQQKCSVFIEPTATPIASRWVAALKETLRGNPLLEKDFFSYGLLGTPRDLNFLCQQLNAVAEQIHQYRGEGPWEKGFPMPGRLSHDNFDQQVLNQWHHDFELLIGQVWNFSPYIRAASPEIMLAIRNLNLLIHELEAFTNALEWQKRKNQHWPYLRVSFFHNGYAKYNLEDEDYEHFTLESTFGMVTMAYCQLGKDHFSAWRDRDHAIFDNNVNGLRYYSGEFGIRIGASSNVAYRQRHTIQPFLASLQEKGIDLSHNTYFVDAAGVKHGLGELKIADMPMSQFGFRTVNDVQGLFASHIDLYQIRVHEDGKVVEHTFDYFADDETFRRLIIAELERPITDKQTSLATV